MFIFFSVGMSGFFSHHVICMSLLFLFKSIDVLNDMKTCFYLYGEFVEYSGFKMGKLLVYSLNL